METSSVDTNMSYELQIFTEFLCRQIKILKEFVMSRTLSIGQSITYAESLAGYSQIRWSFSIHAIFLESICELIHLIQENWNSSTCEIES